MPGLRPGGLLAVALLEGLEVLGLVVLAALAVASGPGSPSPLTAYGVGGTLLLCAFLLAVVAVGTFRARPWARSAGMVWQAVQLLVGAYAFQGAGAQPALGLIAVLPAAIALVLLFTRPVRTAMERP